MRDEAFVAFMGSICMYQTGYMQISACIPYLKSAYVGICVLNIYLGQAANPKFSNLEGRVILSTSFMSPRGHTNRPRIWHEENPQCFEVRHFFGQFFHEETI